MVVQQVSLKQRSKNKTSTALLTVERIFFRMTFNVVVLENCAIHRNVLTRFTRKVFWCLVMLTLFVICQWCAKIKRFGAKLTFEARSPVQGFMLRKGFPSFHWFEAKRTFNATPKSKISDKSQNTVICLKSLRFIIVVVLTVRIMWDGEPVACAPAFL